METSLLPETRPAEPGRRSRLRVLAVAVATIAVLALTATTVGALTGSRSTAISQSDPSLSGVAEKGDFFAWSLATGDFDGDGFDDVLSGSPFENVGKLADAGSVHVSYGARTGAAEAGQEFTQRTPGVAGRAQADDRLGSAVATGDFNADGYHDAVVGLPGQDAGRRADAGAVLVLYGSGSGLRARGSATFTQHSGAKGSSARLDLFGSALATGDFDNDGHDDLAIGAPGKTVEGASDAGSVTVMYGTGRGLTASRNQILTDAGHPDAAGPERSDGFGWAVAAGDFNNDGRDDLVVGVPGQTVAGQSAAGAIHTFRGTARGLDAASWGYLTSNTPGVDGRAEADDRLGASLAAGRLNRDPRDDLAVGAPGESVGPRAEAGAFLVLYGTKRGITPAKSRSVHQATRRVPGPAEAGDDFAASLAIGNFNGAGPEDLAVGTPGEGVGNKPSAGWVYVFNGARNSLKVSNSSRWRAGTRGVPGPAEANASFSRSMAAGDINGDGSDDLIIGSPGSTDRRRTAAGAYVILYG